LTKAFPKLSEKAAGSATQCSWSWPPNYEHDDREARHSELVRALQNEIQADTAFLNREVTSTPLGKVSAKERIRRRKAHVVSTRHNRHRI